MTLISKSTAKEYFESADEPTQQQFWDLLDSLLFKTESGDLNVCGLREFDPASDYTTGMTCIYNNAVYQANTDTGGAWVVDDWDLLVSGILSKKIVLTDDQIKLLYDAPQILIDAIGEYYAPIPFFGTLQFIGSTPYTTNIIFKIGFADSDVHFIQSNYILISDTSRILPIVINYANAGSSSTQILPNKDLVVSVNSGNPEGGDPANKIIIRLYYVIEDFTPEDSEDSGSGSSS